MIKEYFTFIYKNPLYSELTYVGNCDDFLVPYLNQIKLKIVYLQIKFLRNKKYLGYISQNFYFSVAYGILWHAN